MAIPDQSTSSLSLNQDFKCSVGSNIYFHPTSSTGISTFWAFEAVMGGSLCKISCVTSLNFSQLSLPKIYLIVNLTSELISFRGFGF